ncbi:aldo/keto reductase [Mesorhizobium sp. M0684]|uniref:aldo/keto reductase n=1 Tax=unclassified Mesorhizobium TaxID=325217 RepID=UPI00333AB5DB
MQMMMLWDGRSVPRIGIGTWAAGGRARWRDTATIYGEVDHIRSQAALAMAYEIGARVFDTAAAYDAGNAELILGRALRGKDEAVIVTKVGYFGDPETRKIAPEDASAAAIRTSIDNSRQRLQRDCIDVVLLQSTSIRSSAPARCSIRSACCARRARSAASAGAPITANGLPPTRRARGSSP